MTEATNDTARKHVDELIAGGKALYRVFELLDPLSAEDSATPRIRTAVVGIVDGLDALGESPADGVKAAAAALLEQDAHDKAAAFEGWQSVLDAARPYHRTIAVVCSDYPQWIAGLPSETLAPCLKTIGGLCTCYGNDACGLVDTLLRQIKPLAPARQAHHLDTMETYGGHLDTKPLKDLMVVLPLLYELADEEILNRFRETFPVDDLAEKRDAIKCMRATAALAETLSSEERALAVPLVMAAAARSHGSASQVAARLPETLATVDEGNKPRYLETFTTIVKSAGICTVGFCLRELPGLIAGTPAEELDAWVADVRDTGARYGARAAMAFVDKTTATSQASWGKMGL